jgi:hypothetical protein
MARRGFGSTALRAALGAVTGVAEGLQQRDVVAAEKKRMADALARQQGLDAMDRARFLMSSGFRVAPEAYSTEDPAARSVLPPLEMPSATPSSGARASGALSAALNRGMGVDSTQPSLSRPSFGAAPLALDSKATNMTDVFSRAQETRPAQEAIAASVDLPDGMKMRFNAPESAAQIAARTMADYEAKKKADAAIAAQAKADERKALDENARDLADIYVSAYTKNGKPMPYAEALASAQQGKNPIESGFVAKPMSEYESASLANARENIAIARRNAAVNEGRLRLSKGNTQEATEEVQNFYDNERQIIAEFMPTKTVGKDGKVQYEAPKITPTAPSMMATKSDWTNWWASEDAQRYTSSVKRISDSFAVAKEGRGASNADKESYLNAVMVRPGEFKNYKLMDDKWKRLQSYINFLESKEKKGVSNRTTAGTAGGSALEELENMGM